MRRPASTRQRLCTRHLVCMRTPGRFGIADGAIQVTSAAGGKVSDMYIGEASVAVPAVLHRIGVMSALPPKADMCGATRDVCFGPIADICNAKTGVRGEALCRLGEVLFQPRDLFPGPAMNIRHLDPRVDVVRRGVDMAVANRRCGSTG